MNLLNRHRRTFLVVVCIACTGIVAAAYWSNFEPLLRMESSARDFLTRHGRRSPARPELVFLAIDGATVSLNDAFPDEIEASPVLQSMKNSGWPWSRDVYPMIIERLVGAGARIIVFDMLFPTEREGDPAFRAALERHRDKVMIGANFVETPLTKTLTVPAPSLIPSGDPLDPRVGYVNFWPEVDGTVRLAHYMITEDEMNGWEPRPDSRVLLSLAGRALSKLGKEDLIPRKPRCFRFANDFAPKPLWQIFAPRTWEAHPYKSGEFFRDKIVLIGPEGDWAHDILRTPLGEIPGPTVHLHALNAALNRDFVREPSRTANLTGILIAGLAAWALGAFLAQPFLRFITFIVGSVAYYFAAGFIFDLQSGATIIALVPPLLAANGSGLVWLICQQVIDRLEKARTRRTLERYVSKDLVKEILDNPQSILNTLGGTRRPVAILFSDLRDFTTMTEEADSRQLVAQLNEYFTEMVKRIFDSKGTLDKFIGDAIMAVWGEVQSEGPAGDVKRSVTAALEMQSALAELNRSWEKRGIRTLKMGIGINYGEVIVGNIGATGATEKMELTVIGDPVNLASRLEGLTKEFGLELLLGEGAADLVTEVFHLQFVDLVRVKGKKQPIRVYTVLGTQTAKLPEKLLSYLAFYAEGVHRYQNGHFPSAIESFSRCLKCVPADPLASMYLRRCTELRDHPPGSDWDGVFVMTKK
jgi:adenylate cyclase